MPEYYQSTCKNCGEDCDGVYCSWSCQEEWEDGYADFMYEQQKDRELMEQDTHLFMPQGSHDD